MTETLTIIVPVFNEEESLPSFLEEMTGFLQVSPIKTVILFIDDGSTDTSFSLIKQKCETEPSYSYARFEKNCGLSSAIKAGFDLSKTTLTGYIDADLQTHPKDFLSYLEFFPRADMVNGIRIKRQDGLTKKISSRIANAYRRTMINDNITDTCCPLKIIKTEYVKRIPFFHGMHRFLPALIQLEGGIVKEVHVPHYPRYAGNSKYHLFNRLIGPFFDILAFRWMRSRYIRYKIADSNLTSNKGD